MCREMSVRFEVSGGWTTRQRWRVGLEDIEISSSHVMSGKTWAWARSGTAGVGRGASTNEQDRPCFDAKCARAGCREVKQRPT